MPWRGRQSWRIASLLSRRFWLEMLHKKICAKEKCERGTCREIQRGMLVGGQVSNASMSAERVDSSRIRLSRRMSSKSVVIPKHYVCNEKAESSRRRNLDVQFTLGRSMAIIAKSTGVISSRANARTVLESIHEFRLTHTMRPPHKKRK